MYDPAGLYVDPILSQLSVGYRDQNYYALDIMPETPVRTQSGKYRVFDRSGWLIFEDRREPGTVANEIQGAKWSTDTFSTQEHSLQSPVLDEERQELTSLGGLADPAFGGDLSIDPEEDATQLVVGSLQRRHEQKVANLIRNAANYAASNKVTLSGTSQWDNITYGTAGIAETVVSDPVANFQTAMRAVFAATGRWPNTAVIPMFGMSYLENHPRIVSRFKSFSLLQDGAFRALTGFDGRIIPADSGYNSADNIDATEAFTYFWGKDVWIGIVDPTPGQKTKTFGKTFSQIYPAGGTRPTERWREEPRKADIVRSSWKYDLKIVSAGAGYLITNAFSAGAW